MKTNLIWIHIQGLQISPSLGESVLLQDLQPWDKSEQAGGEQQDGIGELGDP